MDAIVKIQEVSTSPEWLDYFGLIYDPTAEFLFEVFEEALEATVEGDENVNFTKIQNKATKLGLEMSEVEMLKAVAVEKIGLKHIKSLKAIVASQKLLPAKLKNKAAAKNETLIAKAIATGVETGWKGTNIIIIYSDIIILI